MVKAVPIPSSDTLRRVLPLLVGLGFMCLLWSEAQNLDWHAVRAAFDAIPRWRWLAAALATAGSFWAVAQYDVIAHRHFQTGIDPHAARKAGAAAIALGQTTGFGPVIGGAIRWRMMPTLGHTRIAKLTGFVTMGFLAGWALLTVSICVPLLLGIGWLAILALPALSLGAGYLLVRFPIHRVFGFKITMPSLPAMAFMTLLAGCDLLCAGLALHLLLPPEIAPPLLLLVAAFAVALGAGMIGGTPGGLGPFEMALVALMPSADMASLAAALIAFRIVYYVFPCLVGLAYAALAPTVEAHPNTIATGPIRGPRAEHCIASQAQTLLVQTPHSAGCALQTVQTLSLFLGPTRGDLHDLLQPLKTLAQAQNRVACLYKVTAKDAAIARHAKWEVVAVAAEAVIAPQTFTLTGSERRQLRRFLRKSETAGLDFHQLNTDDTPTDWGLLQDIHHAWEDSHGKERGLTMGRFCPLYLETKPLFAAYQNGQMIAFASCVTQGNVMSLDVIRHQSDIPTGTMHGLIHFMIEYAQRNGFEEFNLAALPHPNLSKYSRRAMGLARFKESFAPTWRPLYMAAPSKSALLIAAADLWQAIHRPAPIPYLLEDPWRIDAMLTGEIPNSQAEIQDQARRIA